jgi:hypothetical protein
MELTKQQAKENLVKLLAKFERDFTSGLASTFNEETTKTNYIQPFLKDVLGWDVNDSAQVGPEHTVSRGRVDYSLKTNESIRLFVEAKPVKADLEMWDGKCGT